MLSIRSNLQTPLVHFADDFSKNAVALEVQISYAGPPEWKCGLLGPHVAVPGEAVRESSTYCPVFEMRPDSDRRRLGV
jgi:hypothetical protein